ncbi:MAG: NAD(P)/FAD-dependent oxidoreductase [Deltaproteobacteria bacterium]|nr:NAD(P)/FAD-dependent oxidoreductase [Deltaproteobacteria bacterium]
MKEHRCDILVIGAGPAGACAARRSAQTGANVLLAERKKIIGEPVRCAEFIPRQLLGKLDCNKNFIVQQVKGMKSILPDNQIIETPGPGLMINRDIFDQALAQKAKEAGAEIWTETRMLTNDNGWVVAERNREHIRIKPDIIIGADGPHTRVGRWIGSTNKNLIPAVQARVVLRDTSDSTEVYFDKQYFGSYAWLFPKGNIANAGLGIKQGSSLVNIRESLNCFLKNLKKQHRITGEVKGYTAGWVPAGPPRKIVKGNVMLAGDAAGHTHPITGAGVSQAVTGGAMAGKWAAEAIKKGDIKLLKSYEEEWMELYGESLERACKRREMMEKSWNDLDKVIRKCWAVFKEYYRD